tara:strand:- start:860 stop:1213 length:354 start_codon:yes stop_codon:yes gene_type:complete
MPPKPGQSARRPAKRTRGHPKTDENQRHEKKTRKPTPPNVDDVIARMDACPDAESLNDQIISPFIAALESVCRARGYVLNIYGSRANLVVSTGEDVESIYHLIEDYLDSEVSIDPDN